MVSLDTDLCVAQGVADVIWAHVSSHRCVWHKRRTCGE